MSTCKSADTTSHKRRRHRYASTRPAVDAYETLAIPQGKPRTILTTSLPESTEIFPGHFRDEPEITRDLGISLANLARLGCAMPAGGADGAVLYSIMTVTDLGLALYQACS